MLFDDISWMKKIDIAQAICALVMTCVCLIANYHWRICDRTELLTILQHAKPQHFFYIKTCVLKNSPIAGPTRKN